MEALFNSRTYVSLTNFRRISPGVQNHLMRVYMILCCCYVASAIGAYFHMIWNIGLVTTLAYIGTITWSRFSHQQPSTKRVLSLLFFDSFLVGASIGLLIRITFNFDQRYMIALYLGLSLAFVCFTAAAKLARQRKYIYLIALLSSALSILMCLRFTSFFNLWLYIGLLIIVVYMAVETQDTIEKADQNDMNYVQHSLSFFTGFVVFLRNKNRGTTSNTREKNKKKEMKKNTKRGRN